MSRLRRLFEGWLSGFGRAPRRWPVGVAMFAVAVGGLGLSACVADAPPKCGPRPRATVGRWSLGNRRSLSRRRRSLRMS